MAGVRHKAAGKPDPFIDHARAAAPGRRAEMPARRARAAGHLEYVHVACTGYLTAMHTGGRPAAGGVLGGYGGTFVRDGYAGYRHLTGALHGWCGARNLPDPRDLYTFDPGGQLRARSMAGLLIHATAAATAARTVGQPRLSGEQLAQISAWYRGAVAMGITGNQHRRSTAAHPGGCPAHPGRARRLRDRPVLPVHRRQKAKLLWLSMD